MSFSSDISSDTICAIATPSGLGGVGIVRVSGPLTKTIVNSIVGKIPTARFAHFSSFFDTNQELIDNGICLFFPGPNSFTGEDVLEFQVHGGPIILDQLIQTLVTLGARLARPGEFSERAFLNDKIDLAQAEAIADLIESHSVEASKYALRSLQGEFSNLINSLVESITNLRVFVEAAIDFPEEEIDFLQSGEVKNKLVFIQEELDQVLAQARTGQILKEGISIVIVGEPNAGKSSLLNLLSGQSSAIVTDVAGTTRDTLKELITVDGLPLHIIDTAGLRESDDPVEKEGIKRTWLEVKKADYIFLLVDSSRYDGLENNSIWKQLGKELGSTNNITLVRNKIDLTNEKANIGLQEDFGITSLAISAKEKQGIDLLIAHLKETAGFSNTEEGGFIARRRHLNALIRAKDALNAAFLQLTQNKAGELLAEDLREAQSALSEITGAFSSDDLLGEIFSSFCIGK